MSNLDGIRQKIVNHFFGLNLNLIFNREMPIPEFLDPDSELNSKIEYLKLNSGDDSISQKKNYMGCHLSRLLAYN